MTARPTAPPRYVKTCNACGESFGHNTRPGGTRRCPSCGHANYIPLESASSAGGDPRLTVWDGLAPWSGPGMAAGPADETHPACGEPARLTERGTGLYCPACDEFFPPGRVRQVAETRAERSARSAQVADPAAELTARLDLAEQTGKSARIYGMWADALDPEGLEDYELYDHAARLTDRFRALAAEVQRARTPADLRTVRQVAAGVIREAEDTRLQDAVAAARAELARAGRRPELAPADDYADDDDYADAVVIPSPASGFDPGLAPVRAQWAAQIDAAARDIPDPSAVTPSMTGVVMSAAAVLADARRAVMSARTAPELAAAVSAAEAAIQRAGRVGASLAGRTIRPAITAGPGAAISSPAARRLVSRRLAPPPSRTAAQASAQAIADARRRAEAQAARYGRCQIHGTPGGALVQIAGRVLGARPPAAVYEYRHGYVDSFRGGAVALSDTAVRVCASARCRAAAEAWLSARGIPGNQQVYVRLET